jgi:hypothetical protein
VRQDDDLTAPFNPTPGTSVPAGRYEAYYLQASYTPPNGPRAVLGGTVRGGGYYDGTLYSATLTPEWRASAYLRLSADLEVARLDFPDRGEQEWSKVGRLRVFASASPKLSLVALIQGNSLAKLGTANMRLRYNVSEGHDLWIVYGHQANFDTAVPSNPQTARASLLVKYTRSFGT